MVLTNAGIVTRLLVNFGYLFRNFITLLKNCDQVTTLLKHIEFKNTTIAFITDVIFGKFLYNHLLPRTKYYESSQLLKLAKRLEKRRIRQKTIRMATNSDFVLIFGLSLGPPPKLQYYGNSQEVRKNRSTGFIKALIIK